VHSGEVGTPKQDDKFRFLDVMSTRLPELTKHSDHALVVGDLNVGHTPLDIKNWKGNVKRAGFLPEERAYFDRFLGEEIGWRMSTGAWPGRRRPLHLVVPAREGLRQRHRLAHRLPPGHPGTRVLRDLGGGRPGALVGHPLL
jgi:hypothetical protein